MDKPERMDMCAPGNVSETCLAEYQTQPAAYKPNRFIYLKAGHISTSHLDTLVYNNNSVHCNTKFYSDNTHTVFINQTTHSFYHQRDREQPTHFHTHTATSSKSKINIKVLEARAGNPNQPC